jgi:hypothetical protein
VDPEAPIAPPLTRAVYPRHCERSEAIQLGTAKKDGLLRRIAPRNDETKRSPGFEIESTICIA